MQPLLLLKPIKDTFSSTFMLYYMTKDPKQERSDHFVPDTNPRYGVRICNVFVLFLVWTNHSPSLPKQKAIFSNSSWKLGQLNSRLCTNSNSNSVYIITSVSVFVVRKLTVLIFDDFRQNNCCSRHVHEFSIGWPRS